MVVDIVVLLPDSAVFLVRLGSEECGAKVVVREKAKERFSRAERRGEGRDEFPLHITRTEVPLELGVRTRPVGWVLQGRLRRRLPPIESIMNPRMPRVP
jgi:hypothetical protein